MKNKPLAEVLFPEYRVLKCPLSEMEDRMNELAKEGYWYLEAKETSDRRKGGTDAIWIVILRYRGGGERRMKPVGPPNVEFKEGDVS